MTFPAAPTEGGGSKLLFVTTDGNAAGGLFSVVNANTGTGANAVGFQGIATHLEGNAVAAPGGLTTSAAPLVLMGGDDGTNVMPLQVDASDNLKVVLQANTGVDIGDVDVLSLPALVAGTAAIGKLAANSGVDIGDVDVTSILPGVGASNLGKTEDATHGSGDVGVMMLGVENEDGATLSGGDKDYTPFAVTDKGYVIVKQEGTVTVAAHAVTNAGIFAVQIVDTSFANSDGNALGEGVLVQGDDGTDRKNIAVDPTSGNVQVDLGATDTANLNNVDTATTAMNAKLVSGTVIGEVEIGAASTAAGDLAKLTQGTQASSDVGMVSLAVQNAALADLSGGDGKYAPLQVDSDGALYVNIRDGSNAITVDGTITASNATGDKAHDAPDGGNPIKIGGRAQEPTAQPDEVADNDRVDALLDRNGYLHVRGDMDPKHAAINVSTSGNNTIVAAQANKKIAVWAWDLIADGTVDARWEDGADGGSGTFTGQYPFQAREGIGRSAGGIVPLFVGSSNVLLNLELSGAINVHGSVSYTVIDD